MKFLLSWLRDYLEVSVHPEVLAKRLTHVGLEVTSLAKVEGDWIFDAEVTPNRPDLLSHLGIARESAAALGRSFRFPRWLKREFSHPRSAHAPFSVTIEDPQSCRRYAGIVLEGIQVRPSPPELAKRLERLGIRSVNNVVDATNFCLLELGQPLHAFDLDRLEGRKIQVRRAHPQERLVTIDGVERQLSAEQLVIADAKRPVALAGIMGGAETEITESTRRIFLESAWFNPALIRRGTRMTKLSSESSYRFERGVDLTMVPWAALRAARLILKSAGGNFAGMTDVGQTHASKKYIPLYPRRAQELLGMRIYPSQQRRFLERLGCQVQGNVRSLRVEVPSWRQDLKGPEDLYEELARLWGYERCTPTLAPRIRQSIDPVTESPARGKRILASWQPLEDPLLSRESEIRCWLAAAGMQEVLTTSLLSREALARCRMIPPLGEEQASQDSRVLEIQNPLSSEQALLRPSLLPGALEVISRNFRRKTDSAFQLFELGKVIDPSRISMDKGQASGSDTHPAERRSLSLVLAGTTASQWEVPGQSLGLFHLKGILRHLTQRLRLGPLKEQVAELGAEHWIGETITFKIEEKVLGRAGWVDPKILAAFEVPEGVTMAYAELDLQWMVEQPPAPLQVKALAKVFPVVRDLAIVLSQEISHEEVYRTLQEAGRPLLKEINLFDLYLGKQVPQGQKSLAFRLSFSDENRTLTDEEVTTASQKILEQLKASLDASVRE